MIDHFKEGKWGEDSPQLREINRPMGKPHFRRELQHR